MSVRLGVVMDPIHAIKPWKDTTLALLLEASRRGWALHYLETGDLALRDGHPLGRSRPLTVRDDNADWFDLGEADWAPLSELDAVLMRSDPPVDTEYVYATHVLELAELQGVQVVNRPQALRDCNEKLFTAQFPQCCAPTLVSADAHQLRAFIAEHGHTVLKPLDAMGGASIFVVRAGDPNTSVILETLTRQGSIQIMAQRYLPEIKSGDKRILMIGGEPLPWALARIPAEGETRGNLAAGGKGVGVDLTDRDRWICEQVAPELRRRGLDFVGLDVIGDYLTEINVTSPTCVRELDEIYDTRIAARLMDVIESRL